MPLIKFNPPVSAEPARLPEAEGAPLGPDNLRGLAKRFDDIARLVSDWIYETDTDFRLTFASHRVFEALGYHPLELRGQPLLEFGTFLNKHRNKHTLNWRKPFRNVLYRVENRDGEERLHLMSGVPVFHPDTGDFMGVRGTARDITEQAALEAQLHASEERYRTLFNKSPVMACSTDPGGIITSASDFWLSTLGYHRDEVIGLHASEFIRPSDAHDDSDLFSIPGLQTNETPCLVAKRDGENFDAALYSSIQEKPDGTTAQIIHVLIDTSERKRYEEKLVRQANYDHLTGLPNRGLALDRLDQAMGRARRDGRQVAVLFVDLDNFKRINDTLGHVEGDELLLRVADALRDAIREGDTVARLGGDEFLIILPDLDSTTPCESVAQKVLDRCATPFVIAGHDIVVTASIGISMFPSDGDDTNDLLRQADAAMYRSKAKGKNTFHLFSPDMDSLAHEHLLIEAELRKALERDELELFYQPVLRPSDSQLVGLEALIRWHHPSLGLLSPASFIPVAEESGVIAPLGEWILNRACENAVEIGRKLGRDIFVAVNVSAQQFNTTRPHLATVVEDALLSTGLPPHCLELEITESVILGDVPETVETLTALNELGVRLSIDDFGTGFSSMSYLRKFPFDTLKIDRMFVQDVDGEAQNGVLAEAIIAMAHALNLNVIGEGVETQAQLDFLMQRNCDMIQGFYFSKPVRASRVAELANRMGWLGPAEES